MIAAVTEGVGAMIVVECDEPGPAGPGEVVIAPEAVGICGSDYHIFFGELSEEAGRYCRVYRVTRWAGVIVSAWEGMPARAAKSGSASPLMPIASCGSCYPCSVGRPNACDHFRLIGVHVDGGLQDRLAIGQQHVFPIGVDNGRLAAMTEPVSIAVRAIRRARVSAAERVVVLGAGPIGQCACLIAREIGAEVLVVDLLSARLTWRRRWAPTR